MGENARKEGRQEEYSHAGKTRLTRARLSARVCPARLMEEGDVNSSGVSLGSCEYPYRVSYHQ